MATKKKAFSRSTMSLRDFHGGTIPSELALPSAPGTMPERSSVYDRQSSGIRANSSIVSRGFGGERGMFLRQSSGNGVRSFEEKASFFPNPATIGRNYDEDERKPVDSYFRRGYSSNSYDDDRPPYEKRRPVSARSYDHQTLLDRPLDERVNRPSSAPYQEIGRDNHGPSELPASSFIASIPKTQQQDTFQRPTVVPSSFSLGAREQNLSPTPMQEDQSRQISPRPPQYASRLPENRRSPPQAWKTQPQPQQFSGPPSGSATSVPNVWTARQEGEIGRPYSLDSLANEASTGWRGQSAASRFAQASAIEKVSSGRWNSRLFNDQSQERPNHSSQSPGHGGVPEKQLSSSQPAFISEPVQGMYKDISRGGRNDDFDTKAFPHANHELDPDVGREQYTRNVVAAADPYRKRGESTIRHNSIESGQKSSYMEDNLGHGSGDFESRVFPHGNRQSDPDLEREQYAQNVVAVDPHRGRGETAIRRNGIDSGQRRSYMEDNLGRGSSDFERRSFPFGNRESDPDVGREQYTRNVVAVADSQRGRGESLSRHNVIDSGERHRYMEDNSRYGPSDLERRAFPRGIRESDLDVGREQYTRNVVAAADSHRERGESAIWYSAVDSGQRRRYMEDNLGHGSSTFERKSSPLGNRESDPDVGREQYSRNVVAAGDTFRERDESAIRYNVIDSGQRRRYAEDNFGYGSGSFERRASPPSNQESDPDAGRGQFTSNVAAADTYRERDESARYNAVDSGQRHRYMEDNLGHGSSAFERRVSPHGNRESYPDAGRGQYVAAADTHRERDGSVIRHNAIDSERRGRYMEDNLGHGSSDFERKAFLHGNSESDPEEGREQYTCNVVAIVDPHRERGENAIRHNSIDSGQRFRYAEDNLGHRSSDFPRRPGNLYVDSSRDIGKGGGSNNGPPQAMYGWKESQGEIFESRSANNGEIKRGIPTDLGRAKFQNIDTNVDNGPSRQVDPNRGLRLTESRGPLVSEVASQWHAGRPQLNVNVSSRDLHVSEGMKSFQSSSGATKVEKARTYSPAEELELPRDPAFRAPVSSDIRKLGSLSSPILDSRDPPVERPKLKLLPRSKPLEFSPANGSFQQELPKDSQQVSEPAQCELSPSDAGATIASNTSSGSGVAEKVEEVNQSVERPKLILKPRTLPTVEQVLDGSEKERQSVFGGARPRELVLKERGVDGSALEDNDSSVPIAGSGAESQSVLQESSDQQEKPDNEMLQSRRVEAGNSKLLYDQESSRGVRRESLAIDKELDKQDSWRRSSSTSFGSKASEITGGKYSYIPAPSAADLAVAFSRSTSLGGRPRGYITNIPPPRRALGNYGLSPRDTAPFSRLASSPVPVPRQQVFATGFSHGFRK